MKATMTILFKDFTNSYKTLSGYTEVFDLDVVCWFCLDHV